MPLLDAHPAAAGGEKMTRQEAIDTLHLMAAEVEWEYTLEYQAAIDVAVEALSGLVPDPEAGLVDCGCGGKAEYYEHPFESWLVVECIECGANTSYKETKEQARDAWNWAMGYKEWGHESDTNIPNKTSISLIQKDVSDGNKTLYHNIL